MCKKPGISDLTTKQKKFFEYYAQGFTRNEAAKKAGYKAPKASAQVNMQNYTQAFRELFNIKQYGISDTVDSIIEGTKATRVISAVNTDKQATGASCDFIDVPDYNARHKFVELSIKARGWMPNERVQLTGVNDGPIEWTQIVKSVKEKDEAIRR